MKKLLYVLIFLCSTTLSCQCNAQSDRVKNWHQDIDFLLTEIKKQHYVYKNSALPQALTQQLENLKQHTAEYSDERMLIELQRAMYHLGDGHSYVLPFGATVAPIHFLPLHFYEFSDGMFVIDANNEYQHLIGLKVKKIGNTTPQKLMHDMEHFISQDNTMGAKWIGPFFLRFRGLLEAYKLPKNSPDIELQFENKTGKMINEKITFVPVPRQRGIPKLVAPKTNVPLYLSNVHTNFWLKDIPQKKTLYWQFNQVFGSDNESIYTFSKRFDSQLIAQKPRLLIVDVRHNNGGNGDLTPPLIAILKKYEKSQQGKIVVITGRNTFSAAQIFITRVDKETNALFVGEPSSSSPNFVGEENGVILPYSNAIVSISNRYHENNKGDSRKWIEPNLPVFLSSKDYFEGKDPVLEAIFKEYQK
ncbi:MAG: hypothetical protein U0Y10_10455 [Spirosomataceae bacterium]